MKLSRSPLVGIPDWEERAKKASYRAPCLAQLCHASPRALERFFRRQLGTSPQRWLNLLRQAEAEQLRLAGKPIKEIAYLLGFKQASHFSRVFKERHGVPATRWDAAGPSAPRPASPTAVQPGAPGAHIGGRHFAAADCLATSDAPANGQVPPADNSFRLC